MPRFPDASADGSYRCLSVGPRSVRGSTAEQGTSVQRAAPQSPFLLRYLDLNTPARTECWELFSVSEPRVAFSYCWLQVWELAGAGYKVESEADSRNLIRYHGPDALGLPESL